MAGPAGEGHPEVLQSDLPLNPQARKCKTLGLHVEHVGFRVGTCVEVYGEPLELHGEQGLHVGFRGGDDDLQLHVGMCVEGRGEPLELHVEVQGLHVGLRDGGGDLELHVEMCVDDHGGQLELHEA